MAAIVAGIGVSIALYSALTGHAFKNSRTWSFDTPQDNALLNEFLVSESSGGSTDTGNWTITEDSSAPSPLSVLTRVPSNQTSSGGYHLFEMPDSPYQTNYKTSVKFKIPSDSKGTQEAVGLVFRLEDGSHYFVILADYNAQRVSLCRAEPGAMLCLVDKDAIITHDSWHTITADVSSQGIGGYYDGNQLFKRYDEHYQGGGIGVLAKGSSKAFFDDLSMDY